MQSLLHVPGYELIQRLGGGPMNWVYSARDGASDTSCAVKGIRDDWDDPPTAIKLLQREARAGLMVRHPHLVRFLEAHVTRPPYFLVMELLPGESLRRRLRRDYRLDVPTAIWVVRQTAEALAALHHAGFVHGDVKPENIRLVRAGTATLIDLGFAHRPGENAHFFRQGYVLGTANYLAPELCRSDPDEDARSDLFSLGVTFFELLTGELPFRRGGIQQTMARHLSDAPDDIRRHVRGLPGGLVGLIGRLLARDPAGRPRTAFVVQQLIALEIAALRRRAA
jgi:serine/threonine protein kinase